MDRFTFDKSGPKLSLKIDEWIKACTHTHTSAQSVGLATSTEQVSLVMHHRTLGSLHLSTKGKEGGDDSLQRNKGQLEEKVLFVCVPAAGIWICHRTLR